MNKQLVNAQILLLWPGLQPGLRRGFEQKKVADQVCDFFAQNLVWSE